MVDFGVSKKKMDKGFKRLHHMTNWGKLAQLTIATVESPHYGGFMSVKKVDEPGESPYYCGFLSVKKVDEFGQSPLYGDFGGDSDIKYWANRSNS